MICGTPYSPAKALIAFARDFFEYLARGEYGSALGKLDASALQRWDKVTLQRAISSATGGVLITSADGLRQSAKPSVEEVSSGEYILKQRLPLEEKWGGAPLLFFVLDRSPVRSIFTSSWSRSIETVGGRKVCFRSFSARGAGWIFNLATDMLFQTPGFGQERSVDMNTDDL